MKQRKQKSIIKQHKKVPIIHTWSERIICALFSHSTTKAWQQSQKELLWLKLKNWKKRKKKSVFWKVARIFTLLDKWKTSDLIFIWRVKWWSFFRSEKEWCVEVRIIGCWNWSFWRFLKRFLLRANGRSQFSKNAFCTKASNFNVQTLSILRVENLDF